MDKHIYLSLYNIYNIILYNTLDEIFIYFI